MEAPGSRQGRCPVRREPGVTPGEAKGADCWQGSGVTKTQSWPSSRLRYLQRDPAWSRARGVALVQVPAEGAQSCCTCPQQPRLSSANAKNRIRNGQSGEVPHLHTLNSLKKRRCRVCGESRGRGSSLRSAGQAEFLVPSRLRSPASRHNGCAEPPTAAIFHV